MKTRLDRILGREEQEPVWYPEDIRKLKSVFSDFAPLTDTKVEEIWIEYSGGAGYYSWLCVSDGEIKSFSNWLMEPDYKEE